MSARSFLSKTAACAGAGAAAWLAAATPVSASPWGRGAGRLFLSTRADYFTATRESGEPAALGPVRFERYETNSYAEIGVGWKTMLGVKVVYGSSTYFDGFTEYSASGFSEVEAFAQREVFRDGRQVLAVRVAGAAPSRLQTGARQGLASDRADAEARIVYGRTLAEKPVKIFGAVEAGYRRRFGAGADQFRGDALLGVEPARKILGLLELFSTKSLGEGEPGGGAYDVVKIQPSLVWRATKRWSFQAGVTHEAWGRNLLLGDTYFLSLWTEF
ncbi:MAG: hypothetical protein VX640_08060 [Pseudomonadota bacterium]|nr:hypothetical protein [Pseudomonadota bacterium]